MDEQTLPEGRVKVYAVDYNSKGDPRARIVENWATIKPGNTHATLAAMSVGWGYRLRVPVRGLFFSPDDACDADMKVSNEESFKALIRAADVEALKNRLPRK